MPALKLGILALQGGFALHGAVADRLGWERREVRGPADMEGLDALIIPGGESTTVAMGIDRQGLRTALEDHAAAGKPLLGTCAGMVLLSNGNLGLLDIDVERNAYGSQVHSFEADVDFPTLGAPPVRALFIRAPRISEVGEGVSVAAEYEGVPVAVRAGNITAVSFHPELIPDDRVHRWALSQ